MIVNLWSTPRTGSVWYSYMLREKYEEVQVPVFLLSEMFNEHLLGSYRKKVDGRLLTLQEYAEGAYYEDFSLFTGLGAIMKRPVSGPRERSKAEEAQHRLGLLESYNPHSCVLIMHNHTSPLVEGVYEKLCALGEKNIFLSRDNVFQQIASYAVAFATSEFASFNKTDAAPRTNLHCDPVVLQQLGQRIVHWHKLDKPKNAEFVKYEKIAFAERPGYPRKQVRLDPHDQLDDDTLRAVRSVTSYVLSETEE